VTSAPFFALTSAAALTAAAAAGMMFAFSTFVMRGLNAAANTNAPFLRASFGATIPSIVVGVMAVLNLGRPGGIWVLVGAVFGILGALITIAFNVPLNNCLDTVDPAASDAAREWQAYHSTWTVWNHVRTSTGVIAAVLMVVGLRYASRAE
jgi:uncharacterized membrane protein